MSSEKHKIRKYLDRRCEDCGGKLYLVDIITESDGVSYSKQCVVCQDCESSEDVTDKRNKNRVETE